MKIKLLVVAAATVVASSAMAQSAFEGFYGQVGTGYESNSITNLGSTYSYTYNGGSGTGSNSAPNQNANGVPLVIGLGYNFKLNNSWLLGVGADYSALTQESSNYNSVDADGTANGPGKIKISNRYNIFIAPGYAIDKDKLVYAKAGYSAQTGNYSAGAYGTTPSFNNTFNASGYVLGLGYKQIITGGFYGFAEGNYMSYSKVNAGSSWTEATSPAINVTSTSNTGSSAYTLLVGVGYKF